MSWYPIDEVVDDKIQDESEEMENTLERPLWIVQTGLVKELPVTLPSLKVAMLTVPFPMSLADYKALTAALAQFEEALTKTPEPAAE